jgi:hypothetical protein
MVDRRSSTQRFFGGSPYKAHRENKEKVKYSNTATCVRGWVLEFVRQKAALYQLADAPQSLTHTDIRWGGIFYA